MGKALLFLLFLAAICIACSYIGQPASATVMAAFTVLIGGLTGSLAGIIIGTNIFGQNYEAAFHRWLWIGMASMAALILAWTAVLDLLNGGITVSFFPNLWYATFRLALTSAALSCGIMATWAYLVFSRRKINPKKVTKP